MPIICMKVLEGEWRLGYMVGVCCEISVMVWVIYYEPRDGGVSKLANYGKVTHNAVGDNLDPIDLGHM